MSFNFEDETLVERAKVVPAQIKFDNIFSNDLSEEEDYDLCFEADEDDSIISMVSQDDLFNESGIENPAVYLTEEDDETEDTENVEDATSSSDVDPNAVESDQDIDGVPDSQENPKIQVNIDADDVNINADSSQNESVLFGVDNLLEDDISIQNVNTLNITKDEEPAPVAGEDLPAGSVPEPVNPPVPTDTATASDDVTPNLLNEPEEEVPTDSSEEGSDDEDEATPTDNAEIEAPTDECGEQLPNESYTDTTPFADQKNTAATDSLDTEEPISNGMLETSDVNWKIQTEQIKIPSIPINTKFSPEEIKDFVALNREIPMISEVANLLDEEDASTSFNDIEKKDNEKGFHDDLQDVMNKDLNKGMNNAPVDPAKKEYGLKDFEDQHDQFDDPMPNNDPSKTINNAPTDETKKENNINDPDSENKFDDTVKKVTDATPENIINRKPEDTSKENPTSVQEAVENLLEGIGCEEDAESGVMQAVATDITGGNDNLVNTYNKSSAGDCPVENQDQSEFKQGTKYPNLLEEADPSQGDAPDAEPDVFNATKPASKDTSANHPVEAEPKNGGEEDAMTTTDDLHVSTAESTQNLLDEEDGAGILQVPQPEDDSSDWSAIEKDPDLVTKDALTSFNDLKETDNLLEEEMEQTEDNRTVPVPKDNNASSNTSSNTSSSTNTSNNNTSSTSNSSTPATNNTNTSSNTSAPANNNTNNNSNQNTNEGVANLVEAEDDIADKEDADKNFKDIEKEDSSKTETYDVIPDEVPGPTDSHRTDAIGESVDNLLEGNDFEAQVAGISSDSVFYDELNNGLELPKSSTDPETDESELDDEAANAAEK